MKNPKAFMDYSQTIDDHENLQDYNPPKKNVSSVWYDNRLVLRERKLNNSLVFISQSYFKVPKAIRLNATHFMKMPNKRELEQVTSKQLSDSEFKDFVKLYKDYAKEPYSFLVNNVILPSEIIQV